jgi:hypothetical protein
MGLTPEKVAGRPAEKSLSTSSGTVGWATTLTIESETAFFERAIHFLCPDAPTDREPMRRLRNRRRRQRNISMHVCIPQRHARPAESLCCIFARHRIATWPPVRDVCRRIARSLSRPDGFPGRPDGSTPVRRSNAWHLPRCAAPPRRLNR